MKLPIKKGTQSKRIAIFIQDSTVTTGAGKTGLTNASVTWYYWREDEGNVAATSVSVVSATRGTYTSGGFIEKDASGTPGFYEIGIPNNALVSGADWVVMQLKGTGIVPVPIEIQLTGYDPGDAGSLGDAFLLRDWTAVTASVPARSVLNALRHIRNKWSISGATKTVYKEDDSTTAYTTTVQTDAGANPITSDTPS